MHVCVMYMLLQWHAAFLCAKKLSDSQAQDGSHDVGLFSDKFSPCQNSLEPLYWIEAFEMGCIRTLQFPLHKYPTVGYSLDEKKIDGARVLYVRAKLSLEPQSLWHLCSLLMHTVSAEHTLR